MRPTAVMIPAMIEKVCVVVVKQVAIANRSIDRLPKKSKECSRLADGCSLIPQHGGCSVKWCQRRTASVVKRKGMWYQLLLIRRRTGVFATGWHRTSPCTTTARNNISNLQAVIICGFSTSLTTMQRCGQAHRANESTELIWISNNPHEAPRPSL